MTSSPPRRAGRLPRTWRPGVLTAAAVVAGGGAPVVGAVGGAATGGARVGLLALGALLAMTVVWLGAEERARGRAEVRTAEEVAVEAQLRLTLSVNATLAPITSYLGHIAAAASASERTTLVGQLTQGVVDAAVQLTGPASRATFYRLDADGAGLALGAFAGRPEEPRAQFRAGTRDGDFVLGLVARDDWVLVTDVAQDPLVVPQTDGYGTVVATAVVAGRTAVGLLTVDAPEPGDLRSTDAALLRVLGNLLAAGVVSGRAAGDGDGP